jgi:hypothetical protein
MGARSFTNSALGDRLLKRIHSGESHIVPHATPSDLRDFQAERSKCHDNVNRWCREHSVDTPVRGWLVTSGSVFDKHSIIRRGSSGLLDITPLSDRDYSIFLIHEGSQKEFDALPNQVIAIDIR